MRVVWPDLIPPGNGVRFGFERRRVDGQSHAGRLPPPISPRDGKAMEKIAKYSIMGELGRGSHGVVYQALDLDSQRRVALKVIRVNPELPDDDPDLLRLVHTVEEQFKKLSEIEHRNVARIFEAGYQDGAIYIAREMIEGSTLKWYMEDTGRVKVEEAVEIIKDLSKGMKAIHNLGIVLGDFKPSDVMIRPGIPVIVGFGLPAGYDVEGIVRTTRLVESVVYTAPEVIEGSPPSGKSDIYTLGMILYSMLAGGNPFMAGSVANALINVRVKEYPSIEKVNPKVPGWLANVVKKSISRNPDERYATVDEMLDDLTLRSILKEADEGPAVGAEPEYTEPTGLSRSKRLEFIQAGIIVVSFILIILILVHYFSPRRSEEKRAEESVKELQQVGQMASEQIKHGPGEFKLVNLINSYYSGGAGQALQDYSIWEQVNTERPTGLDTLRMRPRTTFTIIAYPRDDFNPHDLKTFALREDNKIREWDPAYGGDLADVTTWKVIAEPPK